MNEKAKRKIAGFVPVDLIKEAKIYSAYSGESITAIIERALREYFDRQNLLDNRDSLTARSPDGAGVGASEQSQQYGSAGM